MEGGATGVTAGRALLAGGLLSLLAFLILTAIVTQQGLQGMDRQARSLVHGSHHAGLGRFMEGASFVGGQPGQVVVLVFGAVVLWPRRRRWAVALPVLMATVGAVQLAAKWGVDRPRPNSLPWGFPSAHVMSLVVLTGCLAYVVTLVSARARWHRLALGLSVSIVGTVGYSRLYLDAHWLSDVLGGVTAGLACLLLGLWLIRMVPSPAALRARLIPHRPAVPVAFANPAAALPPSATPAVEAF
jgi:membrane-associated phospholipid phosphatase